MVQRANKGKSKKIHRGIFILQKKVMRRRNQIKIKGRENIDDGIMGKDGIRDHALNKDGMGLTTVLTDDSGNQDLIITIEDIDLTRIGSMKSPVMMRTGRTDDRIKSDGIDDIIINFLI